MKDSTTPRTKPLCVDLDGTLLRTDLLWEALLVLLKRRPWALLSCLVLQLRHGKAAFKMALAKLQPLPPDQLPMNQLLIDRLRHERAAGRMLILCSASPRPWVDAIAKRTGLFDDVMATDEHVNLIGPRKAQALAQRFGTGQFDYIGNDVADIPVWAAANEAWIVGNDRLVTSVPNATEFGARIGYPASSALQALKALRPHQWLKNALVFVPVLAAHAWTDANTLASATLAAVAFCLIASAGYIVNDLFDLPSDRAHASKHRRPFASGEVPIRTGVLAAPALVVAALSLACFLPLEFAAILLFYGASTLGYSFALKRKVPVDVLVLAGLYVLRIIGGAAATALIASFWLLAFSMFLFLGLALAKRYAELYASSLKGDQHAAGRGYAVTDLPLVMSLGAAASYMAVLVLALYVNNPDTASLYPGAQILWLMCPLMLWWVSRVWLLTSRGQMHDDPVVFALTDRQSLAGGLIGALIVVAASG